MNRESSRDFERRWLAMWVRFLLTMNGGMYSGVMLKVEKCWMSNVECRVKFKDQCVLVVDLGLVMNAPD